MERLKTFDFVVANPPFSTKAWSNGFDPVHDLYDRFEDGIPPKKNGDYAFLLHIIRSMKSTGKGAIILPHGVLFRGNAEGEIRKNIISKGYIKGIIGLPANLFYGTGIPACIIVLDKENAGTRKGIFMIDASKGFYEGRQQEPPASPGSSARSWMCSTGNSKFPSIRAWFHWRRSMTMISTSTSRVTSTAVNPRTCRISKRISRAAFPTGISMAMQKYWQSFPSLKSELFAPSS